MALLGESAIIDEANLSLEAITGVAALDAGNSAAIAEACADVSNPEHC